ncbi:YwqI/YxiC family protein [Shouchella clausii]|jgi:type VII secretion effector (TIGR04197 family)|uniref:YwqI/YxiC family protein n=1 Tax=Shouchella clausii TaxID=79880 RepID=UPI0020070A61|nr:MULTISPECIES: YwqI/YxiC family protein [Shouchella]
MILVFKYINLTFCDRSRNGGSEQVSGEIKLNPRIVLDQVSKLRDHINEVTPSQSAYTNEGTILESIELAIENMENLQQLLTDYQALVLDNADHIEKMINDFVAAEEQVANQIKGG